MFWNKRTESDFLALESEVTDLKADKIRLEALIEESTDDSESFISEKTKLVQELNDYKKQISNLKEIHRAELGAHQLELEKANLTVNRKINSALASIGVNTFAIENFSVDSTLSDKETLNKFNALEGNEKTEYYRVNKYKISRALLNKI